jgi:hypothetical protein
MVLFKKKRVELGQGRVIQYTVFEFKYFLSLIFYRWETIDQVRFHTHAFASIAFLLYGWYWEQVKFGKHTMANFVNVPFLPRFIPRNYCHSVGHAFPGTLTMVIAGPWQKTWWEMFPATKDRYLTWVKYSWGRVVLGEISYLDEDEEKEIPPS